MKIMKQRDMAVRAFSLCIVAFFLCEVLAGCQSGSISGRQNQNNNNEIENDLLMEGDLLSDTDETTDETSWDSLKYLDTDNTLLFEGNFDLYCPDSLLWTPSEEYLLLLDSNQIVVHGKSDSLASKMADNYDLQFSENK